MFLYSVAFAYFWAVKKQEKKNKIKKSPFGDFLIEDYFKSETSD